MCNTGCVMVGMHVRVCSLQVKMLLCVVWKEILQVLCIYEEYILKHMFIHATILIDSDILLTSILSCMWT